jgi:hypothetical protein
MPVNIRLVIGGHKAQSLIIVNATDVDSATFFVLRGALSSKRMGILKLIYFTVRDVVSAPRSARKM